MVNPSDVVTVLVAKLKAIPEVVTELGENANNIVGYEDSYPVNQTYTEAVMQLQNPAILVMWNGSGPGDYRKGIAWEHRFSFILKTNNAYADLFTAISNGTPASSEDDGLPLRRTTIVAGCDPISNFSCDRRQLYVSEIAAIDYFEVSFSLAERGIDA